jgi:mono/diheme cytochrome c family protein
VKKIVKYLVGFLSVAVALVAGFVGFCFFRFSSELDQRYPMHPELVEVLKTAGKPDIELGKRIYSVRNGCIECHGPDLSGAKIMENGAMGSIYGANITPYKTRNLADVDLLRAIRYGVAPDGRSLRFMPSFDFAGLSSGDLVSLIAYLRSVPEVKKPDHVNTYGPVLKVLSVLGKMPVVFPARFVDHAQGFAAKPIEGPTREFGRYLASSCTGCHGESYRGGPIPGGDPSWPPASNIRMGAGGWTEAQFLNVIKTGISREGGKIRAPMPVSELRQMNPTELQALWKYLASLR